MEIKYGEIRAEQMKQHKEQLHKAVHKLFGFKENNYPYLDRYFSALLWQLTGDNELLGYPTEIMQILSILEAARLEAQKGDDFNFDLYRKAILDTHSLIDKISEV